MAAEGRVYVVVVTGELVDVPATLAGSPVGACTRRVASSSGVASLAAKLKPGSIEHFKTIWKPLVRA